MDQRDLLDLRGRRAIVANREVSSDEWLPVSQLVLAELTRLSEGQKDILKKIEEQGANRAKDDIRLTKLETGFLVAKWVVPFCITLAGFILAALKFAGV